MSSRDNTIHDDIRDLLGTDALTPDMERVIGFMRAYRPRVDIDASYRNKLKKSLLTTSTKKITYTHPSWFAWMSWIGTSFAAVIVTLGVVRILFPERPQILEHTPATVESPLPQVQPLIESTTAVAPIVPQAQTEPYRAQQPTTPPDTPLLTRMAESPDTTETEPTVQPADMLADASVGAGYMMMAMPEGDALAKTSTAMPTMMATPPADIVTDPTTSEVDTEIQDMIWEINSIIRESGSMILPEYPTQMYIYSKDSSFTSEEQSLLAGSGITSTLMPTYTPTELETLIIQKRGSMVIASSPEVRYISYKKWNQSFLVPTVIYTTTVWTTLEIALVPGY